MERIEKCTLAWQEHLRENKLLMLYLDDKIKRVLKNPIFTHINGGTNASGLIIHIKSEVVEDELLMVCSPTSGWGSLVETGKMDIYYTIEKNSIASVLLDTFQWKKYI